MPNSVSVNLYRVTRYQEYARTCFVWFQYSCVACAVCRTIKGEVTGNTFGNHGKHSVYVAVRVDGCCRDSGGKKEARLPEMKWYIQPADSDRCVASRVLV